MNILFLARSAAIAGFAFFGSAASAATVTLTFSGEVSGIASAAPVAVGDRVSGTLVLDDQAAGSPVLDGTNYAITSFSVTLLSGRTDTFNGNPLVRVRNDCTTGCVVPGNPAVDGFSFGAASGFDSVSLVLNSADTSLLADESLAGLIAFFEAGSFPAGSAGLSVSTLADSNTGFDRYGSQCGSLGLCQFQAQIDSIGVAAPVTPDPLTPVPLPAGLPLMLAGLGGLALLRRRR